MSILFHIIAAAQNDRQRARRTGQGEGECLHPTERFAKCGAKVYSDIPKSEQFSASEVRGKL